MTAHLAATLSILVRLEYRYRVSAVAQGVRLGGRSTTEDSVGGLPPSRGLCRASAVHTLAPKLNEAPQGRERRLQATHLSPDHRPGMQQFD